MFHGLYCRENKLSSVQVDAQFSHLASCQSPAKLQYRWQPDTPGVDLDKAMTLFVLCHCSLFSKQTLFVSCCAVQTHSSPGLGIPRQSIPATASQTHQSDVQKSLNKVAKAEISVSHGEADEGSIASARVGWFTGAAGQLAASRAGKIDLAEQGNCLIDTYAGLILFWPPVRELSLCTIPHQR